MSFGLFDVRGARWLANATAGDNYTVGSREINSVGRRSQTDGGGNA